MNWIKIRKLSRHQQKKKNLAIRKRKFIIEKRIQFRKLR